jgi:acyl phosphate:glycerol-3-phosphate acyltransferase
MTIVGWALIGYAAGSFPSAWFVAARMGRMDVLDGVRRNTGEFDAHLLLKQVGGRAASIAAALDVLKGLVPVLIAARVVYAQPHDIAACAVGVVAGHCWPAFQWRLAGRGVAAAAGVFLAVLPVEMVIAGIVRLLGSVMKVGGLSSTVGYVAIPLIAWYRGQPAPYIFAAAIINLLIFARRLEGVEEDISAGMPRHIAVFRRVVFDASVHGERSLS